MIKKGFVKKLSDTNQCEGNAEEHQKASVDVGDEQKRGNEHANHGNYQVAIQLLHDDLRSKHPTYYLANYFDLKTKVLILKNQNFDSF